MTAPRPLPNRADTRAQGPRPGRPARGRSRPGIVATASCLRDKARAALWRRVMWDSAFNDDALNDSALNDDARNDGAVDGRAFTGADLDFSAASVGTANGSDTDQGREP